MTNNKQVPIFNLEERTLEFSRSIRDFSRNIPKNLTNIEDLKQLIRSSGSIGANYIEANEALSKKDFKMRVKIARKEAKETRYWLRLLDLENNASMEKQRSFLINESTQLLKILSSIINKTN